MTQAPPGFQTSASVGITNYQRLAAPYTSNCIPGWTHFFLKYPSVSPVFYQLQYLLCSYPWYKRIFRQLSTIYRPHTWMMHCTKMAENSELPSEIFRNYIFTTMHHPTPSTFGRVQRATMCYSVSILQSNAIDFCQVSQIFFLPIGIFSCPKPQFQTETMDIYNNCTCLFSAYIRMILNNSQMTGMEFAQRRMNYTFCQSSRDTNVVSDWCKCHFEGT